MGYLFLVLAIAGEVTATTFLKFTTGENVKWWAWAIVVVGYVFSFAMLQQTLVRGIPLGIAYAIWCGVGIIAVALISYLVFHEALTVVQIIGMGLLVAGVLLLELGASHSGSSPSA